MNANANITQHIVAANKYHSPECVDSNKCSMCRAYVKSVKVDLSAFATLLKQFDEQFGGGCE
ncbi:hypothetical protein EC844_12565 [Acinetobacter calcoaceticus]|uniref:Uncharacterized protein n=1 Tax=Acinetobacter calcoaceticus TaxID=471 RepID=A0A4R1XEP1_ACICA|nr:hypothetical protein EC844_12565 [Acinetobacter calcoaceticus]